VHELDEALALLAQQVGGGDLDVGEEQLGGVLGVLADLLEVPAPVEAVHPRSRTSSDMPLCFSDGSVLTAVMTRSALIPLVMKVLAPLTT